jgi:hypothetical protein
MACEEHLPSNGGTFADYYTCKGQGSQETYDAYYEDYGDSQVWAHLNSIALSNIAGTRGGGSADFVTTHDAILETGIDRLDKPKNNALLLLVGGILAYNFFL